MNIGGAAPRRDISMQLHPMPLFNLGFSHGHGSNRVTSLHQRRGQKLELTREVLMNKENVPLTSGSDNNSRNYRSPPVDYVPVPGP